MIRGDNERGEGAEESGGGSVKAKNLPLILTTKEKFASPVSPVSLATKLRNLQRVDVRVRGKYSREDDSVSEEQRSIDIAIHRAISSGYFQHRFARVVRRIVRYYEDGHQRKKERERGGRRDRH